jgi:uncharacterized protein
MELNRRGVLFGGLGATLLGSTAIAQDITFFRIGTGGTAGTYFPIGGLIANAISNPPGSRACADGGSCGVPGVVATAVASNGSVANVNAINSGAMQSGFTQSDVAFWAYNGSGIYEARGRESSRSRTSRASACRSTSRAPARWSTRGSSWRPTG